MEAKTKAEELTEKFFKAIWHTTSDNDENRVRMNAKKAAIIHCDEMIHELTTVISPSVHGFRHDFYKEVKQHLQSL